MSARPGSPNWYWDRLGASVERPKGRKRVVRVDGAVVCNCAGYGEELKVSRELWERHNG